MLDVLFGELRWGEHVLRFHLNTFIGGLKGLITDLLTGIVQCLLFTSEE